MNRLTVWLIAQAATLVPTLLRVLLVLVFVGRHVFHPSFPFFPGAVCALLSGLQPPLFTAIFLVRPFRLNAPISICRNRFGFATFLRLARRAIDLRLLDVTRPSGSHIFVSLSARLLASRHTFSVCGLSAAGSSAAERSSRSLSSFRPGAASGSERPAIRVRPLDFRLSS